MNSRHVLHSIQVNLDIIPNFIELFYNPVCAYFRHFIFKHYTVAFHQLERDVPVIQKVYSTVLDFSEIENEFPEIVEDFVNHYSFLTYDLFSVPYLP